MVLKLRDEDSADSAAEQARELLKRYGVGFGSMSKEELVSMVRMHGEMSREGS